MYTAKFHQGNETHTVMTSNLAEIVHPNQVLKVLDSLERTGYAEYGWYDIYTTEVQNA